MPHDVHVRTLDSTIIECGIDTRDFYDVTLSWLHGTEDLLRQALVQYDRGAMARITPCLDIGFPNSVQKLAGGFPSGCYVEWACGVPFVPVDAMVHVCTSSVFRLQGDPGIASMGDFRRAIELAKSACEGYRWDFDRGNHFVVMASDSDGYYLVFHGSSAVLDQYGSDGLFPSDCCWYRNEIQVIESDDRYLRYISGVTAERFTRIARSLPKLTELGHQHFAQAFCQGRTQIEEMCLAHHYGMPDCQSIMVGCYLARPGDTVPIFSAPGRSISLYRVAGTDAAGLDRLTIPHGWGKSSESVSGIRLDIPSSHLVVGRSRYPLTDEAVLSTSYRHLSDSPTDTDFFFLKTRPYLTGNVTRVLKQIYSCSAQGYDTYS